MDFIKKVNDFGVFGGVLVVNNNIFENIGTTKIETKEEATKVAIYLTGKAISDQIKKGEPVEGLIADIEASTKVTLVTPNLKDIKLFTEAVIKTAEDGNMCHMKDYMHETGNNIPQEIWDYIYKLTNKL